MIRIIQRVCNANDAAIKDRLEKEVHAGADEFYPQSEGKTYLELTGEKEALYLVVTIPRTKKAKTQDNVIIDRVSKAGTFSQINFIMEHIEDIEIVSACYNESLEPNKKREACMFQFMALRKNGSGILPPGLLKDVEKDLAAALELDPDGDNPAVELTVEERVEKIKDSQKEEPAHLYDGPSDGHVEKKKKKKSNKKRPRRENKEEFAVINTGTSDPTEETSEKKSHEKITHISEKPVHKEPVSLDKEEPAEIINISSATEEPAQELTPSGIPVELFSELDELFTESEEPQDTTPASDPYNWDYWLPIGDISSQSSETAHDTDSTDEKDKTNKDNKTLSMKDRIDQGRREIFKTLGKEIPEKVPESAHVENKETDIEEYKTKDDIVDDSDKNLTEEIEDAPSSKEKPAESRSFDDILKELDELANYEANKVNASDMVETKPIETIESDKPKDIDVDPQLEAETEDDTVVESKIKDEVITDSAILNNDSFGSNDEIPFLNQLDSYAVSVPLDNEELYYSIPDRFELVDTTLSKERLREYFQKTIDYFTTSKQVRFFMAQRQEITPEQFMDEIQQYVRQYLKIPMEDEAVFLDEVHNAMFSYYKITDAINDKNVSDIKVLSPERINVKVKGKHYTLRGTRFLTDEDYMVFIKALLTRNRVASTGSPIVVFTDIDFHPDYALRFNLTLPQINTSRFPVLHVRKVAKHKMLVPDLVKAGMMPQKVANFISEKVKTSSVVFAGPPASGKTTALNAYVEEIPYTEAAICIQESDEIFSEFHPNLMVQHILKDHRGNVLYGLDEIGTNGLLVDISRYIIGEIKGSESRTFLRASNTGCKVMCTIHSPSARETIPRFADYIKYGSDYSFNEAQRMLKDLEYIVYIQGFKVREIARIAGYDDDKQQMIYELLYKYDPEKEEIA